MYFLCFWCGSFATNCNTSPIRCFWARRYPKLACLYLAAFRAGYTALGACILAMHSSSFYATARVYSWQSKTKNRLFAFVLHALFENQIMQFNLKA